MISKKVLCIDEIFPISRPFGLDFIYNHFWESREGLSWEGSVSSIQTTIAIKLPCAHLVDPTETIVIYIYWQSDRWLGDKNEGYHCLR